MIIPCMNSTSAADRGGSSPFVVAGSVLLGLPGAPGCTTVGASASLCCARVPHGTKTAASIAARSMAPLNTENLFAAELPLRHSAHK
jgi:hypothetical protein